MKGRRVQGRIKARSAVAGRCKIMKCPFCGSMDDKVIDSRTIKGGEAIRRRRECIDCSGRFTSYEHIEEIVRMVVKKDGRREEFDRAKVRSGILKAVEKRPVPTSVVEELVEKIEIEVFRNQAEAPAREIGETVMKALYDLDQVAYVRFASVYRQFKDITEFMDELKGLLTGTKAKAKKKQQADPQAPGKDGGAE